MRALKVLAQDRVLVGVPAENAARKPDPNDPHPEINNAEIGYLNEFGAPEINIPARPHLVPGIEAALPKIEALFRSAVDAAVRADLGAIRAIETQIGTTAASSVRKVIVGVIAPPLSDRTLKERKKQGRSRETPLIDTGGYLASIDYVIAPASPTRSEKKGRPATSV